MAATVKQRNLINNAYGSLPDMQTGFTDHIVKLLNIVEKEEKDYRQLHRGKWGISVELAARQQMCQWLARYTKDAKPELKDVLRVKPSCIYAAAMADAFAVELDPWFKALPPEFFELDYSELVRPN